MATGKKSSGKDYTSKGERSNVNKKIRNAVRKDYLENRRVERRNNQVDAFLKGKRVMVTIANPNDQETNRRFIRVPASEVWNSARYSIKG